MLAFLVTYELNESLKPCGQKEAQKIRQRLKKEDQMSSAS